MLIKATLSNARHPEYGEVTIPFPIKTSEYDHTMEMLANLEIGNVMGRDCKIMELSSPYSILQKLEGSEVNIDELDYLAKRLESFEADQDLQFQAAAFARGVASIEDFINLTFCSDQATVIYDFTKLEEAGRQHFMNLHGGCASTEELENLDGYETALLLIDGGGAEITPYGVLYDNGMQMEQLYKGGPFPPYLYDAYELVLPVSPTQSPQNKTYLYLPSSNLQLERTLLRGGIMEREGWFHKLEPIQLSSVITAKLDTRRDSIRELNEMCRSIHLLNMGHCGACGCQYSAAFSRPRFFLPGKEPAYDQIFCEGHASGRTGAHDDECPWFSAPGLRHQNPQSIPLSCGRPELPVLPALSAERMHHSCLPIHCRAVGKRCDWVPGIGDGVFRNNSPHRLSAANPGCGKLGWPGSGKPYQDGKLANILLLRKRE